MKHAQLYLVGQARGPRRRRMQSAQEQFSDAFEWAAIGMALIAPDHRTLRVNKALCDMLGFSREELLTKTVHDVSPAPDLEEELRQRRRLLDGQIDRYERERHYLRMDGSLLWGQVTCTLMRDVGGEPLYFILQAQDISERKLAEQALRESEERFRSISLLSTAAEQKLQDTQAMLHMAAQVGRLGAWDHDLGDARITWSEEVCAIHEVRQGFSPTPAEALAFYAPEARERMHELFERCERDGSPFDVEVPGATAKGRRIWVRIICEAQWDAHGRVRRIHGACQDITESKQAAEHARLLADQLSTTLESLTDAFFTVDRQWRFTYVNAEAERMLRRSRAELLGRPMWQEFPELRGSSFPRQYERALAQNVTVQFEEYYAPFGIWVQAKAYPSKQGLAIYIKDVSERITAQQEILRLNAELEERVRQRTAQLEAANRELEAFSYSIAHDLRAPLSSIDGFSQMLEQNASGALDERCGHYLTRIRAGVRQMGELTDGLLALANLSRTSLRTEPVDLAVLARAAIGSCNERTPGREVGVEIAPELPVQGDPRLLAQVIGNLVGNAWKFTGKTTAPFIQVGSVAGENGAPVYFVRDNGAGFDMVYASKMFEAFHRMHTAAEFEGTGIGLAIVHKIVTRHGGRIWAEAAPQRGATFFFTLPSLR